MKAELPPKMRAEVALQSARMSSSFREQMGLLFESANGQTPEEFGKRFTDTQSAISAYAWARIAYGCVCYLADAVTRYKRETDARLAKLESERL